VKVVVHPGAPQVQSTRDPSAKLGEHAGSFRELRTAAKLASVRAGDRVSIIAAADCYQLQYQWVLAATFKGALTAMRRPNLAAYIRNWNRLPA